MKNNKKSSNIRNTSKTDLRNCNKITNSNKTNKITDKQSNKITNADNQEIGFDNLDSENSNE